MFKFKFSKVIIVSLVLLISLTTISLASGNMSWLQTEQDTDVYDFPMTPDKNAKAWKEYKSVKEKIKACQIPDKTLDKMSTNGLVKTCLKYPLFGNVFFNNSIQSGFNSIKKNFNGLEELFTRKDTGEKLLKIYSKLDLDKVKRSDKFPSIRLSYVELLLAQEDILLTLSSKERFELVKACIDNITLINSKYKNEYDTKTSALIIGRVLQLDSPKCAQFISENESLQIFIKDGVIGNIDEDTWKTVIEHVEEYIQSNKN